MTWEPHFARTFAASPEPPILAPSFHRQLFAYTAGWRGQRISPTSLIVGQNTAGRRPPLFWCLQGFREFAQLGKYLGPQQPVYGMRSGHLVLPYAEENIRALAALYAAEIEAVAARGSLFLGGNCQGCLITFEIARLLLGRGRDVALCVLLDSYGPEPYAGRVLPLFSHLGQNNPYRYYQHPQRAWLRLCPNAKPIEIVSGGYGASFREPHVGALIDTVRTAMDITPMEPPCSPPRRDPRELVLPLEAFRARFQSSLPRQMSSGESCELEVRITNLGSVSWEPTERSGITLANRWTTSTGQVQCWIDGRVELPRPLPPGASQSLRLSITGPREAGQHVLEIDLVEEGLTWFVDRGSQTLKQIVDVVPSVPAEIRPTAEALVASGQEHFERGDLKSAIRCYQQAIALRASLPGELYTRLGDALMEEERSYEAVEVYERALAQSPEDPSTHLRVGRALARLGLVTDAASRYRQALLISGAASPSIYRELGLALESSGDHPGAVDAFQRALSCDPESIDLHCDLARSARAARDPLRAGAAARRGLELEPDNPHLHYLLADLALEERRLDEAVEGFRRSIDLGLSGPWPHRRLAEALRASHRREEALPALERALELDPEEPHLHFCRGEMLREAGRFPEARACFERVLVLVPGHLWARKNLGDELAREGSHEDALRCYHQVLEADPENVQALFEMGECLLAVGQPELAECYFRRVLLLDPDHAWSRRNLELCAARSADAQPCSEDGNRGLSGRVSEGS
ncbi:MAG: tetratricopeptide repeat protein [Planctomycetes bacterium]|nr:tetratricopeptide repeat protein [Planctomycetota bacterium]